MRAQKDNRVQELKRLLNIRTDERVKLSTGIRFRLGPENASEETGGESEMKSTSTSPPGTASARINRSVAAAGTLLAGANAAPNAAAVGAVGRRISPVARRTTFLRALQFGARLMQSAKRSSTGTAPPGIVVRSPSAAGPNTRASIPNQNQKPNSLTVSFGRSDALRRHLRKISTPIPSVSEPKESPSSSARNRPAAETTTQKLKNLISMRQFSSPLSARKRMHHQQSFEQNDEQSPARKSGSALNIPIAGSGSHSGADAAAGAAALAVPSASASNAASAHGVSVVTSQALVHKSAITPQLSMPQSSSHASCFTGSATGSLSTPLVRKNSSASASTPAPASANASASASARPGLVMVDSEPLAMTPTPSTLLPVADSNESNELTSGFYSSSGFSAFALTALPSAVSPVARRAQPPTPTAAVAFNAPTSRSAPHANTNATSARAAPNAGHFKQTQIELKTTPCAAAAPASRDLLSLDQIRADSNFSETLI